MANTVKLNIPENYITGSYSAGTECFSLVDTNRKHVIGDGTGDRKIAVRMYYPAEKSAVAGLEHAKIFSGAKKAALIKAYRLKNVSDEMNQAEYYEGVPIAAGRFPLIMFSSAYGGYIEANTYLLCALASLGYIVASVGHAHEALENDYEDGSTDELDKRITKAMYTNTAGAIISQLVLMGKKAGNEEALRLFDKFQKKYTPFLMNRVPEWGKDTEKALEAVMERYSDSIDLSRGIGASGHSLGGCTAYYLCRNNAGFSCGINIDGALFGDYPDSPMTKPFCQICCKDNINFETRPLVNTAADAYQVIFGDMKHLGFTDAKFYIPVKMYVGKLGPQEMFRHLLYCHTAFFGRYLKGEDTAFDGLPSDRITYTKVR